MRFPLLFPCVLLAACGVVPLEFEEDAGASFPVESLPDGSVALASDAGVAVTPPDAGPSVLVYPLDRKHSPLTAEVVTRLQAIAALAPAKKGNVFSKIGDSNTVNASYLSCFAGAQVDLAGRSSLDAVLAHFRAGRVGTTSPFDRTTLAATVGWSASAASAGTPSPLQQELDAASPRYATVMFGTNDVGFADPASFGRNLFSLVDTLTAQGVVPLITSVPPRDDSATADAWVPRYNLVARGVAQARQVPFIDLHRELQGVTAHGLGPDGIHLNVFLSGGPRGCNLNPGPLDFGHNARNLGTLEALARAWAAVEQGAPADLTAPRRPGTGVRGDEIAVTSLPFVDTRDTRTDGAARLDSYPGCGSTTNEGGREVLYRLELTQPTNLRVVVVSLGNADIDVHLLSDPGSGQSCIARHDKFLTRQLAAGTYWLSLDTYQAPTGPLAGEYLVGVLAE